MLKDFYDTIQCCNNKYKFQHLSTGAAAGRQIEEAVLRKEKSFKILQKFAYLLIRFLRPNKFQSETTENKEKLRISFQTN